MAYTNNQDRIGPALPQRVRDVLGRMKVTAHQNIYEADFEYGTQPLRWEALTQGSGTVSQVPQSGGVRMRVGTDAGAASIRQSRPYHRYQPGKTMFMATGLNLGTALSGNVQRVGFFDDQNGVFFEQGQVTNGNPFGLAVVTRSDIGGTITELRVTADQWNGDRGMLDQIDFTRIQMFWIEYAWYGAGGVRWGFWLNGEPIIAHQIGFGNLALNTGTGTSQQTPWARTGNLPVRYEQRNFTGTAAINDMYHYGVSVIVEGGQNEQRGFTYSYGLPNNSQSRAITQTQVRIPLLTVRSRAMGTIEFGNIYGRYDAGSSITASAVLSATSTASYITGTTLTVGGTVVGTFAVGMAVTALGVPAGTYISALGTGSGGTGTYTLSASYTTGSAASPIAINAYANTFTLTGTPLVANAWVGRQMYFPSNGTQTVATTTASGAVGTNTITVASAAGIVVGAVVSGTGVQVQTLTYSVFTLVTSVSGTTVTLSTPLTATLSNGSLTFTNVTGAGAMGRIVYNTTSTFYVIDNVFGSNLSSAPVIVTTFTQTFASGGAAGATTVVVGSNSGIVAGQYISGTGLQPGTKVEYVNGTTVGFSIPAGAQISGTLSFGTGYVIGLPNRGQLLPRRLMMSSDTRCLVEVIASTPTNPTALTTPVFTPLNTIGSVYSFAERDYQATAMTGGEVVFAFTLAAGSGLQDIDFSYFFALYNNIRGSGVDTLTLAISGNGSSTSNVSANLICQEAMS